MESIYQSCKGHSDPFLFCFQAQATRATQVPIETTQHTHEFTAIDIDTSCWKIELWESRWHRAVPSQLVQQLSPRWASTLEMQAPRRLDSFASWILTVNPAWTAWQSKNASATCAVIRKDRVPVLCLTTQPTLAGKKLKNKYEISLCINVSSGFVSSGLQSCMRKAALKNWHFSNQLKCQS